jgi:hypothetical protein
MAAGPAVQPPVMDWPIVDYLLRISSFVFYFCLLSLFSIFLKKIDLYQIPMPQPWAIIKIQYFVS